MFSNMAPAVKKEARFILVSSAAMTAVMFLAFFLLHLAMPDTVPFDYRVILGGIGGCIVAVLNFVLMGFTVQKVSSEEDKDKAARTMQASYTYRFLMQILWAVAAIAAPFFQLIAGLLPLLFPGIAIKIRGILGTDAKKDH